MSPEVKFFLACLATTPAVAMFIVVMAAMDNVFEDLREAFGGWVLITAVLMTVVCASAGLTFVWTWAVSS